MEVASLLDRVRNDPRVTVGQGATEAEIASAERVLGAFPPDYRAFLAAFGWAELRVNSLYGLGVSVPYHHALVEATNELRGYSEVDWPSQFARLADLGTGDAWILDLDPSDRCRARVLFADVHLGELEPHAESFADWLNAILDDPVLLLSSGRTLE